MANSASWSNVYKRINQKRKDANLTWQQLAQKSLSTKEKRSILSKKKKSIKEL